MTIAAVYVRVSTDDQARHGYSLAAQVDACRSRAESLGATGCLVFADEGVSGALLSRPGLGALREAVRNRSVGLVVVWDPDRLSRNLSHQLLLTEEIERARVRLEFVNFEWKNTPEGQLFYALRGAIAQYEKEKIRERTGRGRLQKARQGKLPAAFRPYGYEYDPAASLLTVHKDEAAVVKDIFRWFLTEGEGPSAIARRLNHLGVPTRRGGPWHRTVVRQILTNPVYTGVFHANRWDTAGCSLNRHRPAAERVSATLRPPEQWVPVPVPALVEPEGWHQAQQRLQQARRLWAGKPRAEYLLSGILTCGRCGQSMSGFVGVDWGVRRRKYTCRRSGAVASGAARTWCGQAVAAEPLEAAVWAALLERLEASPETLWEALGHRMESADGELAAVEAALVQAEKGRRNLLTVLEQGLLPADEASASLERVRTRLAELEARKAMLLAAAAAGPGPGAGREGWAEAVARAWPRLRAGAVHPGRGMAPQERKRLVRTAVAEVRVDGRTAILKVRLAPLTENRSLG